MKPQKPKITFCTGVGTVTGANFLFEVAGLRILVDCGLTQGNREAEQVNRAPFMYEPKTADLLFVTHAHLDHVGRIGKLVKDGFRGTIYSTPETKLIAELIMNDAVGLLAKEAEREGVLPIYDGKDVNLALSLWKTIPYHQTFTINSELSVYLKDAGHILGSSMFEFHYQGKKIVFTGDLGNSPTPILKDTEPITDADYLVMESVYGDRNHEPAPTRRAKLKKIIDETLNRGGVLVIPAFSVERTQVVLYELNSLVEHHEIPNVPVFVDSPLATKVTEIYKSYAKDYNGEAQKLISSGDQIFEFPKLRFTAASQESQNIYNIPGPKIIVAGSGMSMGGRVTSHEAHCLPDKRNTILLVGYQVAGTLGRQLQDGARKVHIGGRDISVKAHIESIFGYSSHKDSNHLVDFVEKTQKTIKKIFVVMGEPKSSTFLVQRLRDELDVDAIHPEAGIPYELD